MEELKNRVEIGETLTIGELTGRYEDIDDVLNNVDEKALLDNGSVSFLVNTSGGVETNLNVEFDIVEENEIPLDTVVKVTNVEFI